MRLRLVRGSIARRSAEAIVTSANPHLSGEANPSYWQFAGRDSADGAVRRAAGGALLDALALLDGLPLEPGSAVATTAGALDANVLVHAVCPDRHYCVSYVNDSPAQLLRRCYASALLAAEAAGASSAAMPAIGCGVRGWPPAMSARVALEACAELSAREPRSGGGLRLLEVVLLEPSVHRAWAAAARAFEDERSAAAASSAGGLGPCGGNERAPQGPSAAWARASGAVVPVGGLLIEVDDSGL